jgi:hypothetical protein
LIITRQQIFSSATCNQANSVSSGLPESRLENRESRCLICARSPIDLIIDLDLDRFPGAEPRRGVLQFVTRMKATERSRRIGQEFFSFQFSKAYPSAARALRYAHNK